MRTVLAVVCVVFSSPVFGQFDPKDMDKTGEWIRSEQLKLLEWKDNAVVYTKKQSEFDKTMTEAMVGKTFEWERKLQGGVSPERNKMASLVVVWSNSSMKARESSTSVEVINVPKVKNVGSHHLLVPMEQVSDLKKNSKYVVTGKIVSIERTASDRTVLLFVENAAIKSIK